MLSEADLQQALLNLEVLPLDQKRYVLDLLEKRDRIRGLDEARERFIPFVKRVWPDFVPGAHHNIMGAAFERVVRGDLRRLIINMPPRFTKSQLTSVMLPSWFLGRSPKQKVIQVSNTENLASGFGRQVRNILSGESLADGVDAYHEIFPNITLAKDSQAAAGWHTNYGGEYFAIGTGGKVAGKGANIAIVDDPHSEQEARQAESNPDIFDSVYEWYTSGIRQRLQPGGTLIIVMQRWAKRDLTGQLLRRMATEQEAREPSDKWEVIELPAILDEGTPSERSMWPGYWPLEELQATRAALPIAKWKAQYQQQPTSEQSAILKRDYWRRWGADTPADIQARRSSCPGPLHRAAWNELRPPACKYILQSWDCAATKNDRSNYNACTTWGVFEAEDAASGETINHIILLSAWKARMEFPELKRKAKQFFEEDSPDTLLIENKSSGTQLIQEFRSMGLPVEEFGGSHRGTRTIPNDKVARANLVVDIFASGYVWAPELRSADELIEECGEFPNGEFDDYVDSTVQAMIRFRAGGFIRTANDEAEDEAPPAFRRRRYY